MSAFFRRTIRQVQRTEFVVLGDTIAFVDVPIIKTITDSSKCEVSFSFFYHANGINHAADEIAESTNLHVEVGGNIITFFRQSTFGELQIGFTLIEYY
jgi:hypothetical protein